MLLRRVHEAMRGWQLEGLHLARAITPLEAAMRIGVGITILVIGLAAVVVGGPKLFGTNEMEVALATFLVFGGMVAALTGASLVKYYYGSSLVVGRVLFGICFAVAAVQMVTGLAIAFSNISISIYLLMTGFISAVISALALK
jgi:hypothetical protein